MVINGFYMDESGNNGLTDISSQPVLSYGGVLIPSDKHVKVEQQIKNISHATLELIKSKTMGIPAKSFDTIPFFNNFEFHGKEFVDGDDFNSKLIIDERVEVIKEIFNLINTENLTIYLSVTNKQLYKDKNPGADAYQMYESGFKELVGMINADLKAKNETCFIVTDDGKKIEQDVFTKVLYNQPAGSILYPDLQTKTSHSSPLIQMADMALFISTVYFRNQYGFPPRKKYNSKIVTLFEECLQSNCSIVEYKK